jgi:hypothetical protein
MKINRIFATFLVILLVWFVIGCVVNVPESESEGGTVIVTNNSNKSFKGAVWTDSKELFNGTIRAWNAKTFRVSEECRVYTDFESDNGGKSSPSGYVSRYKTLILDL